MRIDSPKVSAPEPPRALGLVHGGLGVGQQLGGVVHTEGVEGHPHRGVEEDLGPLHQERLGQRRPDPVDERRRVDVGGAGTVAEQGQELVAPEPGDELGVAGHLSAGGRPPTASTRSPKSWPMVLLMVLNRSRSISTTATEPGTPRQSVTAEVSRSPKWTRLGSPVSRSSRRARSRQGPEPVLGSGCGGRHHGRADEACHAAGRPLAGDEQATLHRDPMALPVEQLEPTVVTVAGAGPRGSSSGGGLRGRRRGRPSSPSPAGSRVSSTGRPTTSSRCQPNTSSARGFHSMTVPVPSTSRKGSGHRATNPVQR